MNTKVLLGTLVGGIVYFLYGYGTYGTLFADMFVSPECVTKPFVMWSMAVSCLIWALLITIICSNWANARTFGKGASVGAIVGTLVSGSHLFGMYAMYNYISMDMIFYDLAINLVGSGITGGVIGMILGMGTKAK